MGVADRVNLGLIPSSEMSWYTACNAPKPRSGGWLHVHTNVDRKKATNEGSDETTAEIDSNIIINCWDELKYDSWKDWTIYCARTMLGHLTTLHESDGPWTVTARHLEFVKSYGPKVDHLVLDLECRPAQ